MLVLNVVIKAIHICKVFLTLWALEGTLVVMDDFIVFFELFGLTGRKIVAHDTNTLKVIN